MKTLQLTPETKFKQEWNEQDFKNVKRAISKHFLEHHYNFQASHTEQPKPKHFYSFNNVDSVLGLAYTSSSDYAGLWCCNSGYLMADKDHHFIGFAITEGGKVVAIADDEKENSIYIVL